MQPWVDMHNEKRQARLALEKHFRVQVWWMRFFTTIIGVAVTNAFLLFLEFSPEG